MSAICTGLPDRAPVCRATSNRRRSNAKADRLAVHFADQSLRGGRSGEQARFDVFDGRDNFVLRFFIHREFGDEAENQSGVGCVGGADVDGQGEVLGLLEGRSKFSEDAAAPDQTSIVSLIQIAIDASPQNRLLSIHGLPLDSLRCRHHHDDHLHRRVVWRSRTLEAGSCGRPPKAPPETDGAFGVSGPPFAASILSLCKIKSNGVSS